ncbi:MAG: ribonuclease [Bacillales bacterium]|nr:ribonuclease [Bacillales bacterium]
MGAIVKSIPIYIKQLFSRIIDNRVTSIAAELAYYFFLAVFPFLIFVITLIGYFPLQVESFIHYFQPYMPKEAFKVVDQGIKELLANQNESLLSFGLIATLWVSSNGVQTMIYAFNIAFKVVDDRPFFRERLLAMFLTIVMISVLLFSFLIPVLGKYVGDMVAISLGYEEEFLRFWRIIRWSTAVIVLFAVFTALYYLAPNIKLKFKQVVVGSLFTTVGWLLVSYFFAMYMDRFGNYTATYGSLGGIMLLLVWFYMSGLIIIIGCEINAIIYHRKSPSK